jgi:ribosomal protein S18 acetylase RimI-like enzyme
MGVSIVKIDASNTGLLDRVAEDVFDGLLEPERLGVFLADGRHILIVAVEDGMVVGQASGMEYLHPDKPPQFFFNEVGVSPDWFSRGIGRRLSAALIEEARQRGCESIWLATAVDNTPAHRCFEAVPEGEPPQTCRIYAWEFAH